MESEAYVKKLQADGEADEDHIGAPEESVESPECGIVKLTAEDEGSDCGSPEAADTSEPVGGREQRDSRGLGSSAAPMLIRDRR